MVSPREWFRDGGRLDWPRVVLAALTGAVLVALVVTAATSTAAFGPYNPSWDGTSELRQDIESTAGVESELIQDTERYEAHDPNETVAFVVAPDEPYTDADAERLQQFVDRGGTLVVLENFGTSGNAVLETVGADARVDGALLRDEQEYFRGPAMPVATGVENHTLTEDVDRLTLNYASAIEPGEATVLVRTSEFAYRDTNRDGQLSDDEQLAARPVATVEPVGDGQVVAIGDPSLVVNAMVDEPDNAAFLGGLYADSTTVLFDQSHTEELPPLVSATLTIRETPLLQIGLGLLGVGTIALVARGDVGTLTDRLRRPIARRLGRQETAASVSLDSLDSLEATDDRRAAILRERHPDWDERRIQRVIAALNRDGSKREDE